MECLSCKHSASDELFGDPAKCPACGVYQAKARAHQERLDRMQDQPSTTAPGSSSKEHEGISDKASSVAERVNGGVSGKSLEVLARYPGAQTVVVVDFRMGFWSMVKFMIKWAIAAIPALFILILIGALLVSLFSGVFNRLEVGRYSDVPNQVLRSSKGDPALSSVAGKGPITLEVVNASYVGSGDNSGMLYLKLSMFSSSDKDIQAIEGRLRLSDRKGNTIGVVPFSASVAIQAHRSSWWDGSIFISSILPGFTGLKAITPDSLASFEPRQIIFSDGTVENF